MSLLLISYFSFTCLLAHNPYISIKLAYEVQITVISYVQLYYI